MQSLVSGVFSGRTSALSKRIFFFHDFFHGSVAGGSGVPKLRAVLEGRRPTRYRDCVKTPAAAPKARNVKAWAIGPGETIQNLLSAKGAKYGCPLDNDNYFRMTRTYFAPSALPGIHEPLPGALPQAVTFRAFGAASRSFHTVSTARWY
jgi:hypothetical protein